MNDTRWINPHQPQPLYMGVILCYVQAIFAFLALGFFGPFAILLLGGLGAGGFGVANEKKWGYALAVSAAILEVVLVLGIGGISALGNVFNLMSFAFDVVLVALLLHPMSRDYQRIWFK